MDNASVHKRESIIFNTIDVINECGIHSVSTKEVAKRLGISEGTIFKYFPKKKNLLYAVLEYFSKYDNDIFKTTEIKNMAPKDAIIFYIESYLIYYESYPAITAINQAYDGLYGDVELENKSKSIFLKRTEFVKKMIDEAQNIGEISKEIDSETLADIVTSTCRGICLKWRINRFNFSLRDKTMKAIYMLLNAFSS